MEGDVFLSLFPVDWFQILEEIVKINLEKAFSAYKVVKNPSSFVYHFSSAKD